MISQLFWLGLFEPKHILDDETIFSFQFIIAAVCKLRGKVFVYGCIPCILSCKLQFDFDGLGLLKRYKNNFKRF